MKSLGRHILVEYFECSSKVLNDVILLDPQHAQLFSSKHNLRYYSDQIHHAAFILPQFVKDLLNEPVVGDDKEM